MSTEADRKGRRGRIGWILGVIGALALLGTVLVVFTGPYFLTAVTGDEVVAHVGECRTHEGGRGTVDSTECDAWWVVDGRRVEGTLDDADPGDEGEEVPVRVRGSYAVHADALPEAAIWIGVTILGTGGMATIMRLRRRR